MSEKWAKDDQRAVLRVMFDEDEAEWYHELFREGAYSHGDVSGMSRVAIGLQRLHDAGLLLTPAHAKAWEELRDVAAMAYGWIADRQPPGESLAAKLNKSILAVDAVTEEEAKP